MDLPNLTDVCFQTQAVSSNFNPSEKNFISLFPLAYGIPTIVLDLFIIVFLVSKNAQKDFSHSFCILLAISGIMEISLWTIFNLRRRLASAPLISFLYEWIPREGIVVSLAYFIDSYVGYLNHVPALLLAINRLSAAMFPFDYEDIWGKAIKPILFAYFLYPIVFTWHFLFLNKILHCQIWDVTSKFSYHILVTQPPYYWIPLYLDITIVSFVSCLSCLALNTMTTILIIKHNKHQYAWNHKERKNYQMEIKMLIITLMMFINEFTIGIIGLIIYFSSPTSSITKILSGILPFVYDLICLSPPWMVIITNKKIRLKLFANVLKKNHVGTQ